MLTGSEALPLGRSAQRTLEKRWAAALSRGVPPADVRPVVRESWVRALRTDVSPSLPRAPLVWDAEALHDARAQCDWLPFARSAVSASSAPYSGGGHILTLFDHAGRMLWSEGDPRALEGLAGINFRPGAHWAEEFVGTNGPGTALATGLPVHIVGAEHFCEQWQAWHCAAMPVRDPLTGEVCGAVDISGFREAAHPHTLTLTATLVVAIEQMLRAREAERRTLVMRRMAELASRWPGDATLAVDRTGAVFAALHDSHLARYEQALNTPSVREALTDLMLRRRSSGPQELMVPLGDGISAVVYPVTSQAATVGACLVVPHTAPSSSPRSVPQTRRPVASTRYTLADLAGDSAALAGAVDIAAAAAETDMPVLIEGESGTGKELLAQGIHAASRRARAPFIAVNCAALPRELVESELFGYVGGAFSGARREGQGGKFEAAGGGTIFLDEVAELPAGAQAALLRVLQEGEITPVGSAQSRRIDVRVIAATNRHLADAVAAGTFRNDLFYRLNVLAITLPPLRERREDIAVLARQFLIDAALELGRPVTTLGPAAIAQLERRQWPGNVRELKNLMRRVAVLGMRALVDDSGDLGTIEPEPLRRPASPPSAILEHRRAELIDAVRGARTMHEAARTLGVTRSTLYRRMEQLGLKPERILSESQD